VGDETGFAATSQSLQRQSSQSLLGEETPDDRKVLMLIEFLRPLSKEHFPAWFRQAVADDSRTLDLLLGADGSASLAAEEIISQIL
jgi:hypothetical protein